MIRDPKEWLVIKENNLGPGPLIVILRGKEHDQGPGPLIEILKIQIFFQLLIYNYVNNTKTFIYKFNLL